MANLNTIFRRMLRLFNEAIALGLSLACLLLVARVVHASPADSLQKIPSIASSRVFKPLLTSSPRSDAGAQHGREAAGTGTVAPSASATAAIQAAVDGVHALNLQSLAGALGLKPMQIGSQPFDDSRSGMEAVSGLSNGESDVAVKWTAPEPAGKTQAEASEPRLYLLSWDGSRWQASYLTSAADALTLQVLPSSGDPGLLFAVIIYRGVTAAPYPVIFRLSGHHASRIWDGRSDSSQYTSYDYGSIQFKEAAGARVPYMLLAGRADPGLLIFPASEEESKRGFQAVTVYAWRNGAYIPIRTEYTHNRDYTIYRFIAALHLHDFKEAYSLIDPVEFLKTKKPSLKLFRHRIQKVWPEFTDDRIFEVPTEHVRGSGSQTFILRLGHGKLNVYHPTFTSGPAYRLTGLARTKSKD